MKRQGFSAKELAIKEALMSLPQLVKRVEALEQNTRERSGSLPTPEYVTGTSTHNTALDELRSLEDWFARGRYQHDHPAMLSLKVIRDALSEKADAAAELSAIHHALLNPMEVVYDPKETWTVRNVKAIIIEHLQSVDPRSLPCGATRGAKNEESGGPHTTAAADMARGLLERLKLYFQRGNIDDARYSALSNEDKAAAFVAEAERATKEGDLLYFEICTMLQRFKAQGN